MSDLLFNLIALGVTLGSLNALIAVSFAVIYNVTHVFHLAHGASFTVAAYLAYWLTAQAGLPLLIAVIGSFFVVLLLGVGMEISLYRPLRRNRARPMTMLLGSFGILIVVEGLAGLLFGTRVLRIPNLPTRPVSIGQVYVTTAQVAMLGSWILIVGVIVYLIHFRSGRLLRAMGSSHEVSASLGIPLDRYMILSFALGSALVVPAALLYAWSRGLSPDMGLMPLLVGLVAAVVGGRHGLLPGAIVAVSIGIIQAVLTAFVPPGWQEGFTFAVLFAALVARPQGLFGYGLRW